MKRKSFVASAASGAVIGAALGESPEAKQMLAQRSTIEPASAITDVEGIKVGHWTSTERPTGCTVILAPPDGAVGGVDVRGSAPGTRETDLLRPENLVDRVNAVLLAGGSAFGLDAASGVMRWLDEHGIGFNAGVAKVPIVPAAILFDLPLGPKIRPDAAAGYAACEAAASERPAEGNVGAGAGATVGKLFGFPRGMKSGIGTASASLKGIVVGAIVAVNAIGDVVDPKTGKIVAGARTADGKKKLGAVAAIMAGEVPPILLPGTATTIGVVATNAQLTKTQAQKIAQMAQDGVARAIEPAHTMFDGDTIFALGTGSAKKTGNPTLIGLLAAEVVAAAILRAVLTAKSLPNLPAASDVK
jgi:L-aminopeptidase/D-esterase-like protein